MICEGNRKLLEWMRGKQCDMRQVGGGAVGGVGGGMMEGRYEEWWRLLSTRCRLRVRGTGTVSRGLTGAPSLAQQPLAFIFTAKKQVGTGTVAFYTQHTAGCYVHVES